MPMWYHYASALLAGIASAVAPGQNATLAKALGRPALAGLACCLVSLLAFMAAFAVAGAVPSFDQAARAPWWAWGAGGLSAVLACAQLLVPKRIGAARFLGLVVTAGVIASITLDHFGLAGFKVHEAGPGRLLGGLLMIGGMALVAKF